MAKAAGSLKQHNERRKLTTTERGYGWEWQKLRLIILAEEPLCRFCKEKGFVVVADEVDHIDGNSFNNERENLRPLCRPCHLVRTARDQAFGKHQYRPEWLRPSAIPLHIVCGPPAGGKSTYVAERSKPADLVLDLDVIASEMSGEPLHSWDRPKWLTPAVRARNELLGELSRTKRWPGAWLILSEPKPEHRQWWADKMEPTSITVIETPARVCMDRVRADASRPREQTFEAIGRWWDAYERRGGDCIVKGGNHA